MRLYMVVHASFAFGRHRSCERTTTMLKASRAALAAFLMVLVTQP